MGGSTAVTLESCNGNLMTNNPDIYEINEITLVIAVNLKISGRFADRAGFKFRLKKWHELLKK